MDPLDPALPSALAAPRYRASYAGLGIPAKLEGRMTG